MASLGSINLVALAGLAVWGVMASQAQAETIRCPDDQGRLAQHPGRRGRLLDGQDRPHQAQGPAGTRADRPSTSRR